MSDRLTVMPQGIRYDLNIKLGDRDLASLDDNARFIVRKLVSEAYGSGFHDGWIAGQNDAQTDRQIKKDAERTVHADGSAS